MIYTLTLNPALDRELTVPDIVFDDVLRATMIRVDYGGKGFNVSRALNGLGAENVAVGFVGGHTGRRIADGLAALGIATEFVEIVGETRTNVSIRSENRPTHIKVNEPGPVITTEEEKTLLDKIRQLAGAGDWWVLSGSLPPGASPAIYAEIIARVQAAGGRAILDTSGEPLRLGCQAGPYLAKPNAGEAAELTGIRQVTSKSKDVAEAIHGFGVKNVLVSMGKAGAIFSDGENLLLAQAPEVEEQNPIGAGDSSVAGLVWGLGQQMEWPEILRWSMACGAATAGLAGTTVGPKEIVEQLVGQVRVSSIES